MAPLIVNYTTKCEYIWNNLPLDEVHPIGKLYEEMRVYRTYSLRGMHYMAFPIVDFSSDCEYMEHILFRYNKLYFTFVL